MPKINQEEYEVLKDLKEFGYLYITRDTRNNIYLFDGIPVKHENKFWLSAQFGDTGVFKPSYVDLFQFIQWEDEEPYNIQELINDFEEAKRINKLFRDSLHKALDEVHESEETEAKTKEELIEKWEDYKNGARTVADSKAIEYADRFINDLNQLDEPETLTQKWIDEHRKSYTMEDSVEISDLQNLLVPKQEEQGAKTVADVIADFYKSLERLKEVLGTEVEELEE